MIIFSTLVFMYAGATTATNDFASLQMNLGQCIADLKEQGLFPAHLQSGPGNLPITFSTMSKDENNTVIFYSPSAAHKINLIGHCEMMNAKAGESYFEILTGMIQKSESLAALEPSCGRVGELKDLFKSVRAKISNGKATKKDAAPAK